MTDGKTLTEAREAYDRASCLTTKVAVLGTVIGAVDMDKGPEINDTGYLIEDLMNEMKGYLNTIEAALFRVDRKESAA